MKMSATLINISSAMLVLCRMVSSGPTFRVAGGDTKARK